MTLESIGRETLEIVDRGFYVGPSAAFAARFG
jgi:hypothetical protein